MCAVAMIMGKIMLLTEIAVSEQHRTQTKLEINYWDLSFKFPLIWSIM